MKKISNEADAAAADAWLDQVRWNEQGLAPAVVQDAADGTVLMMAWMDRAALAATLAEGRSVFWSRSKQRLWRKGEESGNVQHLQSVRLDCDRDCILLRVQQQGEGACHTGRRSCFFHELQDAAWVVCEASLPGPGTILQRLQQILETRKSAAADDSYTAQLYAAGLGRILEKVEEEAGEVIVAARNGDAQNLVHEVADLWFHTLVMLCERGLSVDAVLTELGRRFGVSGLTEKAARRTEHGHGHAKIDKT